MTTNATAELRHVDPTTVAIDDNIRTNPHITKQFVESIASGIRQPLLGYLAADGTVTITDGQRRTLAAREAGLATIPVYLIPRDQALTTDEATIERVVDQIVANSDRENHSRADDARAVHTLALAGLSATNIRKRLHRDKKDVDAALTVAKSKTVADRLDTLPDLTLEQAAILAQYEDDADATDVLIEALEEGRFDYAAQYLADTADERAAIAAAGAEMDAAGIAWGDSYRGRAIREYVRADDGTPITIEDVPTEHRYARIIADEETTWHNAEGEAVDETLIDWSIEHDTDEATQPAEGMIDPRTLTQHNEIRTEIDWQITDYTNLDSSTGIVPMWDWRSQNPSRTAGETITAQQKAEEEEAARQARRRVKVLNKQAVAATEVRITKISEWLTRKTLPKDHRHAIAGFITETLWQRYELLGLARADGSTHTIAKKMTGSDDLLQNAAEGTADRAQIINLAITLAGHEAAIEKSAWRDSYRRSAIAPYFAFLTEVIGHTLTDVEKAMAGDLDYNTIDID